MRFAHREGEKHLKKVNVLKHELKYRAHFLALAIETHVRHIIIRAQTPYLILHPQKCYDEWPV